MKKILITGAAGFIGFSLCKQIVKMGYRVVGIDNLNNYYNPQLKLDRLENLGIKYDLRSENVANSSLHPDFTFQKMDLVEHEKITDLFRTFNFDIVVNLAAQAGVRYSIENPFSYIQSNLVGFANILESCRNFKIDHLVYASSSSVYGNNTKVPFTVTDNVDSPISLYAATKKSNELMSHTYSHLYNFRTTGLRFFTVYGPWGRPDMAIYLFTKAIIEGQAINVFNNGDLKRDFTYVDDIVFGLLKIIESKDDSNVKKARLFNIGRGKPINLMAFISELEECIGKKAILNMKPMQDGDVSVTYSDTSHFRAAFGDLPNTDLSTGIENFVSWFQEYHSV